MSYLSRPRPLILLPWLLVAGAIVAASGASLRIIAAANVTVRQRPLPDAPSVVQLPLGTEVAEAGDADLDKTWVHIVTSDGKEGWVIAGLTRPLDASWKWETQEQVIADRLARKGDGFRADVELVNFIERIADSFSDADGRARMDLYRLEALERALAAVPPGGANREPYASWLARYREWAVYNEPAGKWLVANDAVWRVHDQRASTAAADDIAWFATSAGLAGECEGHMPCYVEWRNRLQGEYLRRHRAGAHAAEAVAAISRTAELLSAPPAQRSAYSFDPGADCAPLAASLDGLRKAVEASGAPDRDATLTKLAALRKQCDGGR